MNNYLLVPDIHVAVTPAGAYHATASREVTRTRNFLFALLDQPVTPALSAQRLHQWCETESLDEALELLYRMQTVGWVRGVRTPLTAPGSHMERDIPPLLHELAAGGQAMLADADGFFLAGSGFTHEAAEALAALSADIAAVAARHEGLVRKNLGVDSAAWSVVDAAGHSQLGFWPLYIGKQHFLLATAGEPCLHRSAFAQLVWGLARRYAGEREDSRLGVARKKTSSASKFR